jgi:hypothetical protein
MSRSSIQTMTIMAVATGAVVTMEENGIAGDVLPAVLYAREVADHCLDQWPETGSPEKNLRACVAHCRNLGEPLYDAEQLYTPLCLTSLAQLLLTDLAERLRDPEKLDLLQPVIEAIDGIHNLVDPAGNRFDVYEEADRLAGLVKMEIGF